MNNGIETAGERQWEGEGGDEEEEEEGGEGGREYISFWAAVPIGEELLYSSIREETDKLEELFWVS